MTCLDYGKLINPGARLARRVLYVICRDTTGGPTEMLQG